MKFTNICRKEAEPEVIYLKHVERQAQQQTKEEMTTKYSSPVFLTTEHLVEASLWLDWPLSGSLGLQPILSLGKVEIWLKFH